MKIEQEIYLKEKGFRPEKCIAELESPVSSEFVTVRINGERHEYFNVKKMSINMVVELIGRQKKRTVILSELKKAVEKLEKEVEQNIKTFDDLDFTEHPNAGFDQIARLEFDNGYTMSVITGNRAYTDFDHPFEVAVMKGNKVQRIKGTDFDNEEYCGSAAFCTKEDVTRLMLEIQKLEPTDE